MEVYSLTARGRALSHNRRGENTPSWAVVYFLAKHGQATRDQIISYVPSATPSDIARLRIKGIITNGVGG